MSVTRSAATRRLRGIDGARGAAMLLVCLSHFGFEYFRPFQHVAAADAIILVTMVASPTFMLISGMMLGLLFSTRPGSFPGVAATLRGRGLFLLTVGHVLIVISCIPRTPALADALTRGFITDAIGIAILLGPWLVTRLTARERLWIALLTYAIGTLLALIWMPEGAFLDNVRYILSGPGPDSTRYNFPLLAWIAVYMLGTLIGEWMGRRYLAGDAAGVERGLARIGALLVAGGVLLKAAYIIARDAGLVDFAVGPWYTLTTPVQKLPPSPAYLLFYGGVGLLMTAGLLAANRRKVLTRLIDWLSVLGRGSLFVFLLQFYVYYVGLYYLNLSYTPLWPLYFAVSIAGISVLAYWWTERGYNKVFDMLRWFGR